MLNHFITVQVLQVARLYSTDSETVQRGQRTDRSCLCKGQREKFLCLVAGVTLWEAHNYTVLQFEVVVSRLENQFPLLIAQVLNETCGVGDCPTLFCG